MIALLLLACTGTADTEATASQTDTEVDWAPEPVEAEWTLDVLDAEVIATLDAGMVMPPVVHQWTMDLHDAMVATDSEDCPDEMEASEQFAGFYVVWWDGQCTTDNADVYGVWQGYVKEEGENVQLDMLYSMAGTYQQSDTPLKLAGNLIGSWNEDGEFDYQMEGSFQYGESEDPAFATGIDIGIVWQGQRTEAGVSGTFDGPIGNFERAMQMSEITLEVGCEGATGDFTVRDPSGGWWRVALDDDCSGCGSVSFAGEDMGETCVGTTLADHLTTMLSSEVAR